MSEQSAIFILSKIQLEWAAPFLNDLQRNGFRGHLCEDANTVLNLLVSVKTSAILVHHEPPLHPGLDALQELTDSALIGDLPVLMISPINELHEKLAAYRAGARDYITTPIHRAELFARITVQINWSRRLTGLYAIQTQSVADGLAILKSEPRESLLLEAAALMHKNLAQPMSVITLAKELGTNPTTLNNLFHNQLNMTAFEYLTELRLNTARHLLGNSVVQIAWIADYVGYRSSSDFARAFRRKFHTSPREYRVQNGKKFLC